MGTDRRTVLAVLLIICDDAFRRTLPLAPLVFWNF